MSLSLCLLGRRYAVNLTQAGTIYGWTLLKNRYFDFPVSTGLVRSCVGPLKACWAEISFLQLSEGKYKFSTGIFSRDSRVWLCIVSVHVKTLTKHRASLAAPMVCSITIIKRFCVSYWLVQITQCCTFMKLDYHLFRFHEWATLGHLDQSIVNTNKSLDYSITRFNSEPTGTVILSDLNR